MMYMDVWICRSYRTLPEHLSAIYHFYLFPDHLRDAYTARNGRGGTNTRQQELYSPVHIAVNVYEYVNDMCSPLLSVSDLSEQDKDDLFSKCFARSKDFFVFDMHIPEVGAKQNVNVYGSTQMEYVRQTQLLIQPLQLVCMHGWMA